MALSQIRSEPRGSAARSLRSGRRACGFSLIELMTVLAISVILAGILLPVVRRAHENVQRVVSASNLRQIGLGVTMYSDQFRDQLPYSRVLEEEETPRELMVVRLGTVPHDDLGMKGWDGLGRLYSWQFLKVPEVFYAPSHRGEHHYERYADDWLMDEPRRIYCNYHYCSHEDWETGEPRRLVDGESLVLATDGLRTRRDLNHRFGMNVLRGDGAVSWTGIGEEFKEKLPYEPVFEDTSGDPFIGLWSLIEEGLDS